MFVRALTALSSRARLPTTTPARAMSYQDEAAERSARRFGYGSAYVCGMAICDLFHVGWGAFDRNTHIGERLYLDALWPVLFISYAIVTIKPKDYDRYD
jgi:hypothetical protein